MAADAVATRRWLFGPVPDLLLGCGLLYALFFAAVLAYGDSRTLMPAFLAPLLVLLFSTPHYGATILRVYEQRSERRRYAVFSVWATLGIAAWFVVGQHWAIAGSLLLTVYLTWSPWHYTGQNYGIAVMLLGRRGVSLDAGTKRWLHWAFIASYLLFFGVIHESAGWAASRALPLDAAGIRFLPLGTPRLLTHAAAAAWILAHGVALVRLLARAPLRDLGPALLLVVSQTLWFALPGVALHWELFGGHEPLGADVQIYFLFWIAVAHAVQYLWITAYYARATRGWNGALPFLARSFAAGAAVWTLPAILFAPVWFGGIGYEAGLALLIGSAVNIHHFVLDGAIWKLRDGPIARVLIRSEAGAEPALAPAARPWPRRTAWAVAVTCGALAAFVFTAEFFLVPHALATQDRGRATALLDALDWLGRDSSTQRGRLAGLSLRAGDPEEAARQFERSVALLPTLEGYGALIETLGKLGRIEEAAAHCEALLALAPRDPRALRLAAAVYQRVGRGEEGRALLARAEAVPAPEVAEAAAAGQRPAIY